MSGKIVSYAELPIKPCSINNEIVLDLRNTHEYGDLEFQKRTHGGVKVVDESGHHIDVIRRPKMYAPHVVNFDPEFTAVHCMMLTFGASPRDFSDFLQCYIHDGDILYAIKRYTNIFNPERDLYDVKTNELTDECIRMMHFSNTMLFDSDTLVSPFYPVRNIFIESIGNIKRPSTNHLYEISEAFQNFFNKRNKRNQKCITEKISDSPLFDFKISSLESSVENIECVEILSNNGSGRKVYIAQHKPTPLGHNFYNYCSSEKTEDSDELLEAKYRNFGLIQEDGNLSNNGANILALLLENGELSKPVL